jgi:Arc/MetJ family transcription regulator
MATNLNINPKLLVEAKRIGKHKTKREAVDAALEEYIRLRQQMKILELFGKVEYDKDYDYKAQRRRK